MEHPVAPTAGVDAPNRLPPVFAKENAEVEAGCADPKAGVDCAPNKEGVAPKAGVDCAPKIPPLAAGWLAPNAGVELENENGDDCAPNAVPAPPKGEGDAPNAGVDVEVAPKLKTI